jgi:excisionase family DNA binding protein
MVTETEEEVDVVTPREAAKKLRVSVRTVYEMIRCGRLQAKPIKSLTGNRKLWLIPRKEVERLEQERRL